MVDKLFDQLSFSTSFVYITFNIVVGFFYYIWLNYSFFGIDDYDFNNKCPNNFPLTCEGKWNKFETFYSTGGSNAGDGMSIRLIKK